MSRNQFRVLVLVWVFLFGCRFLPWPNQIPPDIASRYDQSLMQMIESPFFSGIVVLFLVLLLVGVVGMLRFWKPASYFFIAAPVMVYLTSPINGWLVLSGWESMFEGFSVLLAGALFSTAVFGAAKGLFQAPQVSPDVP